METHLGNSYSRRRRIAIIVTLGLLTGLGPFTIDLYLPAFPALKQDLGINDAQVQLTLSATTIGFALGQLIIGPLSDRVGRRGPLIAMTALHVVASILVAIAPSLGFLTAMRALQGIGAAGGGVVAMAMTRDLFGGKPLVLMLSRLALISGLAPIVAPIVGSWMVMVMDWRGVFWGLAGYGLGVIVLVWVCTVETRPPSERTSASPGALKVAYRHVLGDRLYVGVLLVSAFSFGGLLSYVSSSSVLLQEVYGLTPAGFGAIFAICSVGVFIGIQSGGRLATRFGPHRVLSVSTIMLVLASLGVILVHYAALPYQALVPAFFCYTLGFGLGAPCASVLALQRHRENSGVAASLMGAGNQVVGSIVGPLIGVFHVTSALPVGAVMLACAVFAVASLWLVVRPHRITDRLI